MKYIGFVVACLITGSLGCGDDGTSNPNNVIAPDQGESDAGQETDADMDVADMIADSDIGVPDMDDGRRPIVIVDPEEAAIQPGRAVILDAVYFDREEMEVPEMTFSWASEDASIATVDEGGGVLGVAAGFVMIYAAALDDGIQGEARINVHTLNRAIAAGRAHTCSAKVDNRITCWGDTSRGQLAQPDGSAPSSSPIRLDIFSPGILPDTVATGDDHTCVIDTLGDVYCWGYNAKGQLGNGTTMTSSVPLKNSFEAPVTDLAMGASFTCAQLDTGSLRCWGENADRVLADSTQQMYLDPVDVHSARSWDKVVAGSNHLCALEGTDIWCWGSNSNSQLGPSGSGSTNFEPVQVPGQYFTLFAGYNMTCGLKFDGTLVCWGASPGGLGDGIAMESATPVEVAMIVGDVGDVAIGAGHACVIASGKTFCWGENDRGQVGDTSTDPRPTPVLVTGGDGLYELSLGSKHSCARTRVGNMFCWGSNVLGQVGDGTSFERRQATYVIPTAN